MRLLVARAGQALDFFLRAALEALALLPVSAALVAVAAILVASVRLHFLDVLLHLRWRGPNVIPCHHPVRRGEELGWFEHGSTIVLFVPRGFKPCPGIEPGARVRMGQALWRRSA